MISEATATRTVLDFADVRVGQILRYRRQRDAAVHLTLVVEVGEDFARLRRQRVIRVARKTLESEFLITDLTEMPAIPRATRKDKRPLRDRLMSAIAVTDSGCWEWTGRRVFGYGQIKVNQKQKGAHRVMYEELRGPIPDGLVLDHLCRNPPCVNPDHLEPVTNRENVLRGAGTGVAAYHAGTCERGHTGRRRLKSGKWYCPTCDRARRLAKRTQVTA